MKDQSWPFWIKVQPGEGLLAHAGNAFIVIGIAAIFLGLIL